METNNVFDSPNNVFDSPVGLPLDVGLLAAVGLLTAAGVEAEVVYEGDAHGCPHCAAQILARAA